MKNLTIQHKPTILTSLKILNLSRNSLQKGFTLIELLFVLAVVGILASVAIPSFSQQMSENRLVSNANQLQSVFKFARSEAAKRNKTVTLTKNVNDWEVVLNDGSADGVQLQKFSPTYSTISVTGLKDLTILATGEVSASEKFAITDGDSDTVDYCFDILISGQTFLEQTSTCS